MNIDKIINDVRNGIPVVILDDEDRESEGDIVISAQRANKYNINFAIRYACGLMCVPCFKSLITRLNIPMQNVNVEQKFNCAFTYGIDSRKSKTGVSVEDRLLLFNDLLNENSSESDIFYPGHTFLLKAKDKLLKERRGHTEASLELMKLSGEKPISIISEIMNSDGTMATGKYLEDYVKMYNLQLITVEQLYKYVYEK